MMYCLTHNIGKIQLRGYRTLEERNQSANQAIEKKKPEPHASSHIIAPRPSKKIRNSELAAVALLREKRFSTDSLGVTERHPEMEHYDPELAPVAEDWLDLDEGERLLLVEAYHRDARISMPKSARTLHTSMHVIVENQLAEDDKPVVRALGRLMKEGLTRHDAVHAIGSVVAELVYDALNENDTPETSKARYYAAVERIRVETWRESGDD